MCTERSRMCVYFICLPDPLPVSHISFPQRVCISRFGINHVPWFSSILNCVNINRPFQFQMRGSNFVSADYLYSTTLPMSFRQAHNFHNETHLLVHKIKSSPSERPIICGVLSLRFCSYPRVLFHTIPAPSHFYHDFNQNGFHTLHSKVRLAPMNL